MKWLSSAASVTLALLLAAAPLRAQTARPDSVAAERAVSHTFAHRTPSPLLTDAPFRGYEYTAPADTVHRRPVWLYPGMGAVVGAVVGGLWGTYAASRYDHIGPPPYYFTAPLGAVVGLLAGAVANVAHPR